MTQRNTAMTHLRTCVLAAALLALAVPIPASVAHRARGPASPLRTGTVAPPPAVPAAASQPMYAEPSLRLTHPYTQGSHVTALQRLLRIHADGVFGPQTRRAVVAFQGGHHLSATGVVDGRTWATLRVSRLRGVGTARQVVAVTNRSWTGTHAVVRTFARDATTWHAVFAPYRARVGYRGFGSPKREGDGQTPVGHYRFGTFFGTAPDPGVAFPYRRTTPSDVWVDDTGSPYYNTWQTGRILDSTHAVVHGRRTHVERLYVPSVYVDAAVIRYNSTKRTPGVGSAIFFHVTNGNATSGCVSQDRSKLLSVLRWLRPTAEPRIVMGPEEAVWN